MKYKGMTVNEALCEAGLEKEFYEAVENKNFDRAIMILRSIELDEESISDIMESFGMRGNNEV